MAEEYTLKWFNLEDTDEGGDGGSGFQPIVHVKLVNGGGAPTNPLTVSFTGVSLGFVFDDGHIYDHIELIEQNISMNEYVTYDLLALGSRNPFTEDEEFVATPYNGLETDYSGSNIVDFITVFSDLVNCEENDGALVIIDPTTEASATLTLYAYEVTLG